MMSSTVKIDIETQNWLLRKIRVAAYLGFSFSLFTLLVGGLIPFHWSIYTYIAFGVGNIIAIIRKSTQQPNPLRISVSRYKTLLSEGETLAYLEPFWETFHRYWYWIPIIPTYVVLIIMNSVIQKTVTSPSGLLVMVFIGFGLSTFLCDAIYTTYLLREWKREILQ